MKIDNNKITQASKTELYRLYIERDMDEIMPFCEYIQAMRLAGYAVTDEKEERYGGYN